MQRMFMIFKFVSLSYVSLFICSCSVNSKNNIKTRLIEVDTNFSVVTKGEQQYYKFPWKINLPVDSNGKFLIPNSCNQFKEYVHLIYSNEIWEHLKKAFKKFTITEKVSRITNLEEMNQFEDYLETYFQEYTAKKMNSYFLNSSIVEILNIWGMYRLKDYERDNLTYLCKNDFQDEKDSIVLFSLTIFDEITYGKN